MNKLQSKFGVSQLNSVGGVEYTIIRCDMLKILRSKGRHSVKVRHTKKSVSWLYLHIEVNMFTKFQVQPIQFVRTDRQTGRLVHIYPQT